MVAPVDGADEAVLDEVLGLDRIAGQRQRVVAQVGVGLAVGDARASRARARVSARVRRAGGGSVGSWRAGSAVRAGSGSSRAEGEPGVRASPSEFDLRQEDASPVPRDAKPHADAVDD